MELSFMSQNVSRNVLANFDDRQTMAGWRCAARSSCMRRLDSSRGIAKMLGCSRSWVSRVIQRFREYGEAGLYDWRGDNGSLKLDEAYLGELHGIVSMSPQDFGFLRPTWTRELLVRVMRELSGVTIIVATMSRAL